jgi:hypothetical protein
MAVLDTNPHTISIVEVEQTPLDIEYLPNIPINKLPVEADPTPVVLYTDGTYLYPSLNVTDVSARLTSAQLSELKDTGRNVCVRIGGSGYYRWARVVTYMLPSIGGGQTIGMVAVLDINPANFTVNTVIYYSAEYTGT